MVWRANESFSVFFSSLLFLFSVFYYLFYFSKYVIYQFRRKRIFNYWKFSSNSWNNFTYFDFNRSNRFLLSIPESYQKENSRPNNDMPGYCKMERILWPTSENQWSGTYECMWIFWNWQEYFDKYAFSQVLFSLPTTNFFDSFMWIFSVTYIIILAQFKLSENSTEVPEEFSLNFNISDDHKNITEVWFILSLRVQKKIVILLQPMYRVSQYK